MAEITGLPEMMDGRVKTLHPKIHGGLLAVRENEAHLKALADHAIPTIDLLAANLYPFEQTVAGGADFDTAIETIDIGGPAMIRAAAKNHDGVTVVVDPADYAARAGRDGRPMAAPPRLLCAKRWRRAPSPAPPPMTRRSRRGLPAQLGESTPKTHGDCRHARRGAALWREPASMGGVLPHAASKRFGVATARQVQGKELSYNNLNDTDAAYELVAEFDPKASAAVAIIKHANPCGVATRQDAGRGLPQGAGLRSGQRVRRHRRAQPHARRRGRARDRQDLHRGDHRARRERRGEGDHRREEESAPAAGRRAARSEARTASPSARSPAAFWCSRATTAWSPTARSRW